MKTYEENKADTNLVVKSLTVLQEMKGGAIEEIRKGVDSVRKQSLQSAKQVEKYWETLTDDGVITPIEKQSLKREMENITRSEAAVTTQASALGYSDPILDDYVETYEDLYEYIFDTIRLFDDMETPTTITDRDAFNTLFSNYFYMESFVLLAITQGILGSIDFRVLQSLDEEGEEGETALYHGGLYQYTDGRWKAISTGNYKGAKDELPAPEEDSFFLASDNFTQNDVLIVNGTELLVNGEELLIIRQFVKGYIYYVQDGIFYVEEDKTNWRYAAAFADVLNVTGELPQIFQDGLDALQDQIDATNQTLNQRVATLQDEIDTKQGQYTIISGDIVLIDDALQDIVDRANEQAEEISDQQTEIDGKISHLPEYLGLALWPSQVLAYAQPGDYCLDTGLISVNQGKIIRKKSDGTTEALDPTNDAYNSYYMIALPDILRAYPTSSTTFGAIFAKNIIAQSAAITELQTKEIKLQQNGAIQSADTQYVKQSVGIRLDAAGIIDANKDTHIGGKVAIGVPLWNEQNQYMPDFSNYNTVIGGNVKIKGQTDIESSMTLKGVVSAANFSLSGFKAGNIVLRRFPEWWVSTGQGLKHYSQICGTGTIRIIWQESFNMRGELRYFDVAINEGESVGLECYNSGGGGVTPAYLNNYKVYVGDRLIYSFVQTAGDGFDGVNNFEICTDGNNGVLAWLGTITSETLRPSPAR